MMSKKHPLPISTFGGSHQHSGNSSNTSSNTSMCFPNAGKHEKHNNDSGTTLCGCHRAPKSHCISATGVLVMVLLYTAMGSILFVTLEAEVDEMSALETAVAASKPYPRTEFANAEIRSRTVDRLWSITEDLNILYKENWTRLAAQEVQLFQDTLLRAVRQAKLYQSGAKTNVPTHKWTYSSAFLYSLTLITTIGYGGVSPRTQWGRVAALIYALFGIPVVLLYLSSMGEGLAAAMRCLIRKARTKGGSKQNATNKCANSKLKGKELGASAGNVRSRHFSHNASGSSSAGGGGSIQGTTLPYIIPKPYQMLSSPTVPISICVMVLVCYIASGALLFHKLQNWSILESLYFCFTSLGTIGFGELTPTGNVPLFVASAYILIGMAVVALCFNLIQFEIMLWLGKFGVQDRIIPQAEDLSLVTVAMTPKVS